MENKIDVNEIVRIETMPKVFSQLEQIGAFIDEQIKDIDILECTEENKQEVKQRRTEINNILKELDDISREIVVLHTINDLKFKEIAKIVDKPLGTVLWIYNKAIKDLKRKVGAENE